jgi:UDP-glucuronate decarboxylase
MGPLNLGNPIEFTIHQLAQLVLQLTGSKSEIQFNPLPQDDPKQRRPEISLAKEVIGWEPRVPLEEGLQKTIGYFDDLLRKSKEEYDSPWLSPPYSRLAVSGVN